MYQHHPTRHLANRSQSKKLPFFLERLELRTLLSGGVFDISRVPAFTPSSADINDAKNGPLANFGTHLVGLYSEYKKYIGKGGVATKFKPKVESFLVTSHGRTAITLRTRGSMAKLTDRIHAFGGELILRNSELRTIDAWVPIKNLSGLARDAAVLNAQPNYRPASNFLGAADNQGDIAQNADSARLTFGVDGSGVKVGVLSDSVNRFEGGLADSQASGDLPPDVQVIDDTGFQGSDEGRAMLELIHDIAPGASLAFASANDTPQQFARNVIELQRAGCNIIVDDVTYFNEPFFQDGIISQAVTDVVENHGVTYFSSAANGGQNGFETDAHFVPDINGRMLLDFDPSDKVDTRQRVDLLTAATGASLTLQWNQPYNGIVGAASIDLDINLINPTTGQIVAQSADANLATTNPIEIATGIPPGLYDVEVYLADKSAIETALPTRIKFNVPQNGLIRNIEYPGLTTNVQGHNAGQNTISVGAVPFYLAPPFNNSQTVTNEDFSSFGPVTYFFKSNGVERNKPITLLKPDISGTDGSNTSFFGADATQDKDKLPNFFGTSAAAPNVAAVAALMKEYNPDATPLEIKNALIASAKNNPLNGQLKGQYNQQAGFGLIDGLLALQQILPGNVVADIGRVVPDSVPKGIDQLSIRFSSPVSGFTIDDLELVQSKDETINLLEDSEAKLTTDDQQTYILKNLENITDLRGTYFLRLKPVNVTDKFGHPALNGEVSFFVSGKPTGFVAIPVTATEADLSWTDNNNKELGFRIYRAINEDFTKGLQTFKVKANVIHFKDTGLSPTTQYFYKVKAIDDDGAPDPTTDVKSLFTLAPNEQVVDNRSIDGVVIKGGWELIPDEPAAFGGDYLAASPKREKSVTFTPELTAAGTYYLYIRGLKSKSNSTNTPVDILVDGDSKKTITVNQATKSGWVLLGQFSFKKGTATSVRVRNTGADGTVIADAVRFQRTSTSASSLSIAASAGSLFSTEAVKRDSVLD